MLSSPFTSTTQVSSWVANECWGRFFFAFHPHLLVNHDDWTPSIYRMRTKIVSLYHRHSPFLYLCSQELWVRYSLCLKWFLMNLSRFRHVFSHLYCNHSHDHDTLVMVIIIQIFLMHLLFSWLCFTSPSLFAVKCILESPVNFIFFFFDSIMTCLFFLSLKRDFSHSRVDKTLPVIIIIGLIFIGFLCSLFNLFDESL